MLTPWRRGVSTGTSAGHVATATGPGELRSCPAAVKPRARVASTSGAAARCRSIARPAAPHRVHEQCGARAGHGGRRQGDGLACAAAVAHGPKNGDYRSPVCEQDGPQLPLNSTGESAWRKSRPLARAPGGGSCGIAGAGTSTPNIGRNGRAFPGGRPAGMRRRCRPPTKRGHPLAGSPRRRRRCASSSARCQRPPSPASRGRGGIQLAWPGARRIRLPRQIAANPGGPGRSGPT